MTETPIRFAPDILRRLGEELNPSVDQGILELVKNSYDADADYCVVRLDNVLLDGGTICVEDNGDGLDFDDIVNGWLVLGRSRKVTARKTNSGRTPAGNKGLGRLAALRLGTQVELVTRPRNSETEFYVSIDWSAYDDVELVESVPVRIVERVATRTSHGTTITVKNLRRSLGRMEVKRLARALILLADPFDTGAGSFQPRLESDDFEDLASLVESMYFSDAEYHLTATLRGGVASAEVTDWRGGVLFSTGHDGIARTRGDVSYDAPDCTFDLWVFLLNRASFQTRNTSVAEVKTWMDNFGGVHLYLNGLRVAPYGNPGNDWLDINLRRVQSPEERPGTNTAIGRILVDDRESVLDQKTDRSGFIESTAFDEVRAFAQDSMEWMARRRLAIAEARRQKERSTAPTESERSRESLRDKIQRAPTEIKSELNSALETYDRQRQRETDALRREVQLYRTLSTAGITAATFAHESGNYPLKIITQSINAIEFRGQKYFAAEYENRLADPVESIRHACESLGVLSTATVQLVDSDKRRLSRVDLHPTLVSIVGMFRPLLDGRDVSVELDLFPHSPYVQGSQAALESIVTNFFNNSLNAFERSAAPERNLRLQTLIEDSNWILRFSDNGPGLSGISPRDIWLPGNTTRPSGTGLGLTIVKDAVADLGGNVSIESQGDLGGATFVVQIPILGVSEL